ncbi:MAG TPA: polyprenyl diphosphate synthase [Candidatus Eisenbacteria bacterium]|jgi:undecaprenyl diphosphate synthase|nr:polyprenyl diphosphate synthase [Candidatus Eisenbacteria bacterium]
MTVQQVILQHILSAPPVTPAPSLHVAIITDGNGRWATSRGLPRSAGHRAGAEASRAIIEAAPKLGIHTLTLFALSSANWTRPASEVHAILRLLHEYLMAETTPCMENGVRISVLGRRDRIPMTLRQAIIDAEAATAGGKRLHLRLAIDYSAREAIYLAACRYYKATELSPESFGEVLSEIMRGGTTDVDLLIRTGGEQRLSDFLLWECAFAEFVFLEKRWPDFTVADLRAALEEFSRRDRTRGSLPQDVATQAF